MKLPFQDPASLNPFLITSGSASRLIKSVFLPDEII